MKRPRIVCPRCLREVVKRKDGTPRNHYPPVDKGVRRDWRAQWCGYDRTEVGMKAEE